jgi:outer membrane receptor protein involved in Fe transport
MYLGAYFGGAAQVLGVSIPDLLSENVASHILTGGTSFANLPGLPASGPGSSAFLHQQARAFANSNMLMPGDGNFEAAINAATNGAILTLSDQGAVNIDGTPRLSLGARIIDVSTVSTFEANYDFEDKIDFANLIVGGLVRSFNLDTEGTLYTDYDEAIEFNEFGVYAQMQKDLMDDNLSLTASMRYDKQDVMEDANITPRLGLLYKLSDNSNIRVSAQVGYRNPTNQDKFIGLFNGEEVLLGSTKENIDRFSTNLGGFDWTGNQVFDTALNKSSWDNGGNVVSESLDYVEAEKVTSYDIGYRYNSKDFTLDMNAYYSQYENFIGTNSVYVPAAIGQPAEVAMALGAFAQFGVDANLDVPFDTYGFSVEAIKRFSSMYSMNLIYEYNQLDYTAEANSDFELSWNTPEHRLKLGFTANLAENTSFSANARYNSEYYYESSFIDATIRENTVLDAKFMFAVPALDNLQFELGGNNIAGRSYVSIPGSGQIGSLYYCGAKIAF